MNDLSKKAEILGGEEYFEDMVTITRDTDEGICIRVNEERNRLNVAYFKAYNHSSPTIATMVARLHFKDEGIENYEPDLEKQVWRVSASDIKRIINTLKKESVDHPGITNWQYACYQWNYENEIIIDAGINKYFNGEYDEKLKDNPAYVPSTQPMPEGWVYNPPDVDPLHECSEDQSASSEAFFEMAGRLPRDPSGKCSLVVAVGDKEKNIAHFHVFKTEEDMDAWRNGACLFFTENRYYDHAKNQESLTKDELMDLIRLLKSPYKRDRRITNWQQLVYLWNDNNERYEIPDDTPMPIYDCNTITRYTE